MAKTIKFNLILDGFPVRNLEGLQEHFSIEDVLKYYESGLLQRWLKVRGYEEQLSAVEKITTPSDEPETIVALIKAFDIVDVSDDEIKKSVSILQFEIEERMRTEHYCQNSFERKKIIDDYHTT